MSHTPEKNIVLFVALSPGQTEVIKNFKESPEGHAYRVGLLYQNKPANPEQKEALDSFDVALRCNFDSPTSILQTIKPIRDQLVAATCRSESNIPAFQKLIPHIPYLRTPTTESLDWATNKLKMRRRFAAYDRSISPIYKVAKDAKKKTLAEIESRVGFPLVIKPTGLALSLLVTIAYHPEELEKALKKVFRKIRRIYKETSGRGDPSVLIEQFIEGDMYSVDAHISSRGRVYFNPFVYVQTGRSVGFDDFFAYRTTTPTLLNKTSLEEARVVSTKAIRALGLRSTSVHIELLKTEKGWKVIEVGPRIGGFRQKMYDLSYGLNTTANDIFIRIPLKPRIPRRVKGHTAVLKMYAKKEGVITSITGIKKARELRSFHSIKINKRVGDKAVFAKHGGKDIFNITFFNKERSKLLADIRRFEQMVHIETSSNKNRKNTSSKTKEGRTSAQARKKKTS